MVTGMVWQAVSCLAAALILAGLGGAAFKALARAAAVAGGKTGTDPDARTLPDDIGCWAVLDGLPDPVVIRDLGGRIVGANRAYARLAAGEVPAAEDPQPVEREIETPAGRRWIAWAEGSVEIDGVRHRVVSGRDVTDSVLMRQRLEEAGRRAGAESEAKSRLLATVSHEFRTPLNGILGMTRLLLETGLDPEQRTYAQAVRSSAEAFLTLVDDILDFSRIEAGRIELADEPFELGALVQGIVELLAPRAQGKGTEIAAFVAADVPHLVRGDPDRLRQVLFNLAGNAVKFTRTGGVGISVERAGGDRLAILIEDTGPGIAPDRAAEMFEEFETGEPGPPGEAGSGLGLAITRRLVTHLGGTIVLESVVGEGARFHVDLPLQPVADASRLVPARDRPAPLDASGPILILSASPYAGPYLARTLGEASIEAVVVGSLPEALDRMRERRFAALVADHALPGADVRVAAREADRHGVARTVVLLSPFERRDFGSPHAAGFDAYLVKPVRPRSLFEQISSGAPVAALRPPAPAPPPSGRYAARVLLAEDNEINALVAMKTLERLGAVVEWARDGREAWARLSESLSGAGSFLPFDLVLMDLRMPEIDGLEVTRRVRLREAERPGHTAVRIAALTASGIGEIAPRAREAGIDALLSKPFTVEDLDRELELAIARPQLARAS